MVPLRPTAQGKRHCAGSGSLGVAARSSVISNLGTGRSGLGATSFGGTELRVVARVAVGKRSLC